ncbi:aromatic amino acid lyase [Arthrobacter sp. NPDC058127]|uniref:aromatic amino acid lyase n=1 Tax=Arthrobacter sp. NPDC058127 TaxID=3346351 RepID=UPI0036E291DF
MRSAFGDDGSRLQIDGFTLGIDAVVASLRSGAAAELSDSARERCRSRRAQVARWLTDDAPVIYGVNTGLGNLKDVVLSPTEHAEWNRTIPYPHAAGLGDYIHPEITRTALLVRANVLARGYSGARPELIERLIALYNAGISPAIRELASVGLSDLAPLSHIAMVVSGIPGGRVLEGDRVVEASRALAQAGLPERFAYECKDTLSTINGASMTQAAGVLAVHSAGLLLDLCDELDIAARNVWATLRSWPASAADRAEVEYGRAAFGASIRESFAEIRATLDTECNVSCDNPLLFAEGDEYVAVMGCNCSNTQVGYDLDLLCILLAERAALLLASLDRLITDFGLSDELYEDAARSLQGLGERAAPASTDSIPTKSGQEDHVEFSYGAARKVFVSIGHLRDLLSIIVIALVQAPAELELPPGLHGASRKADLSTVRALIDRRCEVIPFQVRAYSE